MKSVHFIQETDFTGFDHSSCGEIHKLDISCVNLEAAFRFYALLLELNFDFSLNGENNVISINNLSVYRSKTQGQISLVNFLNLSACIRLDQNEKFITIEETVSPKSPLFTVDKEMDEVVAKTANHRRDLFLQRKKV